MPLVLVRVGLSNMWASLTMPLVLVCVLAYRIRVCISDVIPCACPSLCVVCCQVESLTKALGLLHGRDVKEQRSIIEDYLKLKKHVRTYI